MNNDKKIFEIYEKYNLNLNDRIVAFHLLGYIEKALTGNEHTENEYVELTIIEIDDKKADNILEKLLEDKKNTFERCLKYYEEIYSKDTDLMDKMLYDEYLLVLREYKEKHSERLEDIFRCVEEIINQK